MAEKILIIDDDLDTLRLVGLMLQRQGYEIAAASDGAKGLIEAKKLIPNLILLDVMMPNMDGYEVARLLREDPETASIPILMFTAKSQLDDKVTGFEAGADDYLTKPTHPSELQAHVKALLSRSIKARPAHEAVKSEPTTERRAHMIGVISARGGTGTTSVAFNLGSALQVKTKKEVIVAEMQPGRGTLAQDMNTPPIGLKELLNSTNANITPKRVKDVLIEHQSGLKMLMASYHPLDTALLLTNATQLETIFNRLMSLTHFAILDLGANLSPITQKLLKLCHECIIVAEPTSNSLIHAKALINDLNHIGINSQTISVVLNNRFPSEVTLTNERASSLLSHPVAGSITPAPELFIQGNKNNQPAILAKPNSLTTTQYLQLADHILGRMA